MADRKPCRVDGCERQRKRKGTLCSMHAHRRDKFGDVGDAAPQLLRGQPEANFWAKVEKTPTCWLWVGAVRPTGYGAFAAERRSVAPHRYAYQLLVGPIEAGLEIDHLCRVRNCVNPAHLEAVTPAENLRRRNEANGWANA